MASSMYKGDKDTTNLIEKLVCINKVTKVTTGGKRLAFAVLVVVGDGKGRVGFGSGKAREIVDARNKAVEAAKKAMIRVSLKESRTLHHDCEGKFGSGYVVLRSAASGTGVIAGGAMRAVFECLGIQDIVSKSIGSNNPYNVLRATFNALENLNSPKNVADRRSKHVSEIIKRRNMLTNSNSSSQTSDETNKNVENNGVENNNNE